MKNYMPKQDDLLEKYKKDLIKLIDNKKEIGESNAVIYQGLFEHYGIIVTVLTEKYPDMTLEQMKPVTQVVTNFQKEYFRKG